MQYKYTYKLFIILVVFLLGLYYYTYFTTIEGMKNKNIKKNKSCPNMLVEKDGKIYLYNSKIPIDDKNPIKFNNLEEYIDFVELQKTKKINCPVLFLQYTTDTQNNDLIQVKPSIFENTAGLLNKNKKVIIEDESYYEKNKILDATLDSTPNSDIEFNSGMYSGFDQYNQNVGLDTPLDKIFKEQTEKSRNPMDPHWGGKNFTMQALEDGDYKDREVYRSR